MGLRADIPRLGDAGRVPAFDRRRSVRHEAKGAAMASFRDDGDLALTEVEIKNVSLGGMGLLSPVRVEAGSRLTLFARGGTTPSLVATVARCEADDDGRYVVGIRYDVPGAA